MASLLMGKSKEPNMLVNVFHSSAWEAETGRSKAQCQPKLHRVEGSSPYQDPISKKFKNK